MAAALKAGYSIDRLYSLTKIDPWFLHKFRRIVDCTERLEAVRGVALTASILLEAKQLGFSDKQIGKVVEM